MTTKTWDEIGLSLRLEIQDKRASYLQAKQEFDKAIPSGMLNIKSAGASHRAAVTAYRLVLREQHDFYLSGVIPSRFTLDGPPYPKKVVNPEVSR
jgi:hypothetical protein